MKRIDANTDEQKFYFGILNKLSIEDLTKFSLSLLGFKLEDIKKKKKMEIIETILDKATKESKLDIIEKFLETLSRLNGVSVEKAKRYLAEVWRISPEKLETVKRKTSLALLLHELNLVDDVEGLVFATSIEKSRTRYQFSLNISEKKDLRNRRTVKASLRKFCEFWNSSYPNALWADLVSLQEDTQTIMIKVVKESGRKVVKQFRARSEGRRPTNETGDFRLHTLEIYPISFAHIYIQAIPSGGFNITSTSIQKKILNLSRIYCLIYSA